MSSARSVEYRVELTSRAESDLAAIYDEIDADDSEAAYRWYKGLEATVMSLTSLPNRGIRTREDRRLLYGNKPHLYRIIYLADHSTMTVAVLHIRHGARDDFEPKQIDV